MRRLAILLIILGNGCASTAGLTERDPDTLYPWGASKFELEERYGRSKTIWIVDQVPEDTFAAATVRAMLSTGSPRPQGYQLFLQPSATPGKYYRDYVFYNDRERVLYVARRIPT